MESESGLEPRRMRLRYAGVCRVCAADLPARTEAIYERSTRTVRCLTHDEPTTDLPEPAHESPVDPEPGPVDPGTPGASARREHERRQARRQDRVRTKHPKLGGFILAVTDDPQSTTAWATGAVGEETLGRRLNERSTDRLRVLHDRRIPRTKANIDHLAVTPTGVWVIDAKRYKGRPMLEVEGGILRPRVERLRVGRRDCTKVVDGVLKQVEIVRGILGEAIPVHGVLCFVEADWPLVGGAFTTRGVQVLWPKRLYSKLESPGELDDTTIGDLHRALAAALPVA